MWPSRQHALFAHQLLRQALHLLLQYCILFLQVFCIAMLLSPICSPQKRRSTSCSAVSIVSIQHKASSLVIKAFSYQKMSAQVSRSQIGGRHLSFAFCPQCHALLNP